MLSQKQILESFQFFWHPWHTWGRLSSGDIWVLRFVLIILLQWRRLADFFTSIKMISHITFMLRSIDLVILSLIIPKKVTITKIHHLIRLNFERSEHKKSQCGGGASTYLVGIICHLVCNRDNWSTIAPLQVPTALTMHVGVFTFRTDEIW